MHFNQKKLSFCVLLLEAFVLLMLLFFLKLPILELGKIGLFIFMQVICSGFFLAEKWRANSIEEKIAVVMGIGVSLNIGAYFIAMLLNAKWLYFAIPFVFAVLGVFKLQKRYKINGNKLCIPISTTVLIFLLGLLILSVLGRSYASLPSNILGTTEIYKDSQWVIGNINSLLLSYPPSDIRFAGLGFNYHYLSFIFMAVMSAVTDISADFVMLYYIQFITVPLVFFSIIALGKRFFADAKKPLFFTFIFFFTQSALTGFIGRGAGYYNGFISNILYRPNGVDFGTIFLVLTAIVYIDLLSKDNKKIISYVFLAAFTAVTLGSKGPFGMTILAMGLGMVIISLLKKEKLFAVRLQSACNFSRLFAHLLWHTCFQRQ